VPVDVTLLKQQRRQRMGVVRLHLRRSCNLHIAGREHAACLILRAAFRHDVSTQGNAYQFRINVGLVAST